MAKASVTLSGVPLAGVGSIAWRFTTGTQPYTAVFSVHRDIWDQGMKDSVGIPRVLSVTDARGVKTEVKEIYILHQVPSDSPNRRSFLVADKRWKWAYRLIARDYNVPRKTGNRTANLDQVPIETVVVRDKYDFLPYSLDGQQKWTPKRAVEDVLHMLDSGSPFEIQSFPIEGGSGAGEFTLQNVTLRDQGDVALARLLSYVPGAEVTVNADGKVVVFDGTDLDAAEQHLQGLPLATWSGEAAAKIDRRAVRPSKVVVHYQREVEAVFDFSDNYAGSTSAGLVGSAPFLENVIPTVDPQTELSVYDPEGGGLVSDTVPAGTWVEFRAWLAAMDLQKPAGSLPWTFDTIARHWVKGDLDGVLGGRGLDQSTTRNVSLRIQAIKQHFRQTFRTNRRYMERLRDLLAVRVALIDPVTGARAPSAVWSQACIVPSEKGKLMAPRKDPDNAGYYRNVDYVPAAGTNVIDSPPGPAAVNILDRDLGIFRVEWILDPAGTVASFIPCQLVGDNNQVTVPTRNLALQDTRPMGPGMRVESGANGIFLSKTMDLRAMMTIIPAAPNNPRQFHRIEVDPADVSDVFRTEFGIADGQGPDLEVFIPPGELTARFAWKDDGAATSTIADLLGLRDDDPNEAGIDGDNLAGFVLINDENHLSGHAKSVAAELLASYSDSIQGTVATEFPEDGLRLVGNMATATLRISGAPSAKVDAVHQFPGQQKPISRFSLLPESARAIILGTVNRE